MITKIQNHKHRFIALVVAALLLVSMIPTSVLINVSAATDEEMSFTFTDTTVGDAEGAVVSLTGTDGEGPIPDGTIASGTVSFTVLEDHIYGYSITKTGYETLTGQIFPSSSVNDKPITLVVADPVITTQPTATSIEFGSATATFTVVVSPDSLGTISYQWYEGATPVALDSPTLTVDTSALTVSDSGRLYYVEVSSDLAGSTDSDTATLTITPKIPTVLVTADPPTGGATYGDNVTLKATLGNLESTAVPTSTVTFFDDGTAIAGASTLPVAYDSTDDAYIATYTYPMPATHGAITATYNTGDINYDASSGSLGNYTVDGADQITPVTIIEGTSDTKTYGDPNFTLTGSGGNGDGDFKYFSTNTTVADVDDSGEVTIKNAGDAIIKVYKDGDGNYNPTKAEDYAEFALHVDPIEVTVSGIIANDKVYNKNATATLDYSSAEFAGKLSTDTLTVSVTGASFSDEDVAGTSAAPTAKSVAWLLENITLGGASSSNYVVKSDSQVSYALAKITAKELTVSVTVKDKQYNGNKGAEINSSSLNGIISGDTVNLTDGEPQFVNEGASNEDRNVAITFISDFSISGADANNYYIAPASIRPTVVTANILKGFVPVLGTHYKVSEVDGTATTTADTHGWYKGNNFVITAEEGYKVGLTDSGTGDWNGALPPYSTETTNGSVTFYVIRTGEAIDGIAQGDISSFKIEAYQIDKTAPTTPVIEYSTSVLDKVIETITFGFYKAPVTVTITSSDTISDLKEIRWSYAGTKALYDEDAVINSGTLTASGQSFQIPAQFVGKISAVAEDNAGNTSSTDDVKKLVVDDKEPTIVASYTPTKLFTKDTLQEITSIQDENSILYYNGNAVATFEIDEANFFAEDIKVSVQKTAPTGAVSNPFVDSNTAVTNWIRSPGTTKFTGTLTLSGEGDYIITVKYTDRSTNEMTTYTSERITIDTTSPSIAVSYDNNSVKNGQYFKTARTATITVVERNFRADDLDVTITAKDAANQNVAVDDYASYLTTRGSWTPSYDVDWHSTGDTHTATITFSEDANYEFAISYNDLATNSNSAINVGASAAPWEFTVDKTLPTGSISVGEWSASVDGTVWDKFFSAITFGLWSKNAVIVDIQRDDALSGVDVIEYFRTPDALSLDQLIAKATGWTQGNTDNIPFTVSPDEQFIVYAHVVDTAGNDIYLNSDGVIVDQTRPEEETIAPEITTTPKEQPINGIYNGDVKVAIKVVDPIINGSIYSGLQTVTYKVTSLGTVTQEGTLYDFTETSPSKADLLQTWTGDITVEASKNNSNDVKILIYAKDNSGNESQREVVIKIDITKPTIAVTYDLKTPDSGKYFKADRTATIVVTERNFDAETSTQRVVIENTDASTGARVPELSEWTVQAGTGNGDDTTYTATITYSSDGDYKFNISNVDLAGNTADEASYENEAFDTDFILDKTLPTISVTYDNSSVQNTNYYKAERTATITITEHNFSTDRIVITGVATDDGATITFPAASGWTPGNRDGNAHTATIRYSADAKYTFSIAYKDLAGNDAVANTPSTGGTDTFFVDKTVPTLSITGVEDKSANNGDVIPVINFSDTNFNQSNVTITLTGANRGSVSTNGRFTDQKNGQIYTFDNFEKVKENDDIYTLTATLTDFAGNQSTQTITFSVNRFGSVYVFADSLKAISGQYVKSEVDVVVTETNVDSLKHDTVTLKQTLNGTPKDLAETTDYSVAQTGGNGQWSQYTYTVKKSLFAGDGRYTVAFYSEDEAGNINENIDETKEAEISFGIDKTAPVTTAVDIENSKQYAVNGREATISVKDNLVLESVTVYLNGNKVDTTENGENYVFNISASNTKQSARIVAVDAAGNETTLEVNDFLVTTNLFYRWFNNTPLFAGSLIVVGLLIVGAAVFFLFFKKKKEEEKA
jgi:hypothetical protein